MDDDHDDPDRLSPEYMRKLQRELEELFGPAPLPELIRRKIKAVEESRDAVEGGFRPAADRGMGYEGDPEMQIRWWSDVLREVERANDL